MQTAGKQIIGSVREVLKHLSVKRFTVEEDRPSSGETGEALMCMFGTTTNVGMLPSVRKTLIPVDKSWYQMYLTDALRSMNNY